MCLEVQSRDGADSFDDEFCGLGANRHQVRKQNGVLKTESGNYKKMWYFRGTLVQEV